jgi:hypothetical protein
MNLKFLLVIIRLLRYGGKARCEALSRQAVRNMAQV